MGLQRIISIVLVVGGIVMLIKGISGSESFSDQMSKTFTGKFTESTQWYLAVGLVSTIVGLIMLGTGFRRRSA